MPSLRESKAMKASILCNYRAASLLLMRLGFALLLGSIATSASAIECDKPLSVAESTICSSSDLLALENERASLVGNMLPNVTLQGQSEWFSRRDGCGDDRECLETAYLNQLQVLHQLTAATTEPTASSESSTQTSAIQSSTTIATASAPANPTSLAASSNLAGNSLLWILGAVFASLLWLNFYYSRRCPKCRKPFGLREMNSSWEPRSTFERRQANGFVKVWEVGTRTSDLECKHCGHAFSRRAGYKRIVHSYQE